MEKTEIKFTEEEYDELGQLGACYDAADCWYYPMSNVCRWENGRKHIACPVKVQVREEILCDEKLKIEHPIAYKATKKEQDRYESILKR